MRKLAIIIITIISVLFLAGCQGNANNTTGTVNNPFIGGSVGLLLDFMDGAPPREVFDGGEFPFAVTLKVQNQGEANVAKDDITVAITGVKASDFGLNDPDLIKQAEDDLTRRFQDANGNIIEGTTEYVTFDNLNFQEKLAGNQEFIIRGEVCYKYQTKAVSKLCYTKDILDTTYNKVCIVDQAKQVHSSGAPVQVNNFRELPRGKHKIQFSFDINHVSNGDLFKQGTSCEYEFQNENRVWINVETGLNGLKCNGLSGGDDKSGYVTLYNRMATITCTQDATDVQSDFEKLVDITLDYDFKEFRESRVIVKHGVDE